MATIELYEDNAGAVYLHRDGRTWGLGPVTPDMNGAFPPDAAAWASGDWDPNEDDGQSPFDDTENLTHIATWCDGIIRVITTQWGERVAGGGGDAYIGHVLVDADQAEEFLTGLDDVERARHAGQLIEQARSVQSWLSGVRARAIADAADDSSQAALGDRLGITQPRISQMVTEGRRLRDLDATTRPRQ
jgi:hypothetical protein